MRVDGYTNVGGAPSADPQSDAAAAAGRVPAQRVDSSADQAAEPEDAQSTGDSIEISQGARDLLGHVPVRPEMVERARQILSSGTYNDKGAIENTAEKISESFSAEA